MKTVRLTRGLVPIDIVTATLGREPPIGDPAKRKDLLIRQERRIRSSSHMVSKAPVETVLRENTPEAEEGGTDQSGLEWMPPPS